MKKSELLKIIPQNLSFKGESVTFLENSYSLHSESSASNFREFLIKEKIRHNVACNLDEAPHSYLINLIKQNSNGIFAFETTGLSESFNKLKQIIIHFSNGGHNIKLIECIIDEAIVRKIPSEAGENVELYSLYCFDEDIKKWELKKRSK